MNICGSLPQEPLVFIHVALLKGVANSMDYIKIGTSAKHREEDADTAIFYSISSTTPGLQVHYRLSVNDLYFITTLGY